MVNVRCRGPVLAGKVVRVRRERAEAVRIALSAIEHVGAGQGNVWVDPGVHVRDQLVLVVETGRLHQKNGTRSTKRKLSAAWRKRIKGARQRCIDVSGAEQMHPVRS